MAVLALLVGPVTAVSAMAQANVSAGDGCLSAPEAVGGVRYVVNSAGEVVPYVRGGALEVSEHAIKRMTRRRVSIDQVDDLVGSVDPFRYFHEGVWKTGYYDSGSRLFVGSVDDRITTVIDNAKQNYINNLRAARP